MATHQPEKDETITLRFGRTGNRQLKQALRARLAQLPEPFPTHPGLQVHQCSLEIRLTLQENMHEVAVTLRQLADMIDQLHVDERAP